MFKTTQAEQVMTWLEQDAIVLIDVREQAEYVQAHIEKARLIPLSTLSLEALPRLDKPIVIHCQGGKRSQEACEILLKLKPDLDLYNLEGGIKAWRDAGYPVAEKFNFCTLSPKRQADIIKGALVLSGTLLGYLYSGFFILPLLVGGGLIFNGIADRCYLAEALETMSKCKKSK